VLSFELGTFSRAGAPAPFPALVLGEQWCRWSGWSGCCAGSGFAVLRTACIAEPTG
jgi:hypothetical protein